MSKSQIRLIGVYQLGETIGKGAFGKVYKALNIETGQIVAIKQISISNISEDQSRLIEKEITLMKRLSHKNIVKYIDVITTDKYLNIVLEYVENGSLSGIVKKFSAFQEHLVSLFISQVLQGLKYLHSQGVVHRDIKGANLLTTKDGTVKLADFGVAMKLTESTKSMSIVGTPYWMAPEIVEQTGRCTTSCDIWSLGCTVIELLTGKPPYFDLEPMSALYRIVQDEYPPIPQIVSNELKDFLTLCFQKEPFFRKSAQDLLSHPWLAKAHKKLSEANEESSVEDLSQEDLFNAHINKRSSFHEDEQARSSIPSFSGRNLRDLLSKSLKNSSVFSMNHSADKSNQVNESIDDSVSNIEDHSEIDQLVETLDFAQSPKDLHRLLELLSACPSSKKLAMPIMPVLKQILDEHEDLESLHLSLQLTNSMCCEPCYQELAGRIGLLTSALRYISEEFCKELRIEAAFLIGQLFQANDCSLHILMSAGGVEAIIKLLDPNFQENKELVVLGIDCLMNLLEDGGKEYLRVWASHGAIERLALALDNMAGDPNGAQYIEKTADLLLIFSTGCSSVLLKFCEEDVLSIIISCVHSLPEHPKLQILTALKNLAAQRNLQSKLENAGFIVDVVRILKAEKSRDVILACILTLNSICKLSPARQEQAVLAGVVPILLENLEEPGKMQQLCISLLCSFISASVACRTHLHKSCALKALIGILKSNPRVFDAISNWTALEPSKCKSILLQETHIKSLVEVFNNTGDETVQGMIKILRSDDAFALSFGSRNDFLQGLFTKMAKCHMDAGRAKNCLDLLLVVAVKHSKPRAMMDENSFYPLIVKILHTSRDEDLVVLEEIATLLLTLYSGKVKM